MLEEIKAAIAARDYQRAELILKQLQEQDRENPWINYYQANLKEAKADLDAAIAEYRQLLQNTDVPKIISSARQGIARIEKIVREQKQAEIDRALAEPENQLIGFLILQPIPPAAKQAAAQHFAKITNLDPYTARMQLPSRSWRLYRSGKMGELKLQVKSLQQAGIPCFCQDLKTINRLQVYRVSCFEEFFPETVKITVKPREQPEKKITFNWQEITQKVDGLLPLFGLAVHTEPRGKLYRKTEILDYIRICDLHLPSQNIILRLCDFNFKEADKKIVNALDFVGGQKSIGNRENWHKLELIFQEKLPPIPIKYDFSKFAASAIDKSNLLTKVKTEINLLRREESLWDNAFEIYSRAIFLNSLRSRGET